MVERPTVCFKLILFLLTLPTVHTNPCPSRPLWDAHARTFCQYPSWYHCLENQAGNIKEFCIVPRYINQGRYPVLLIGGQELAEVRCPSSRYQPNGQMSNQYKSVTCMYIKDECKDDGEEPCDDGSDVSDRMCRCDYTRGYRSSQYFLSNPHLKSCYHPKFQEAGCIMLPCKNGTELNKAYQCVPTCPPGYYKPKLQDGCVPDQTSLTSTESATTRPQIEESRETEVSVMKDKVPDDNATILGLAITLSLLLSVPFVILIIYCIRSKKFLKVYRLCDSRNDSDISLVFSPEEHDREKDGEKHHKTFDNTYRYADVDAIHKQDIGKRIGCIKLTSPTGVVEYGTGFRVGDRYVMTAYHVVQGMYDRLWKNLLKRLSISAVQQEEGSLSLTDIINCLDSNLQETVKNLGRQMITESSSIRFGYFHENTGEILKFKYDVPFISKTHDIAILELKEDPSKVFPDSVELISLNAPKTLIHILGHPEGWELQTDPGCKIIDDERELEETIKESVKYFSSLFVDMPIDESDFLKCKISAEQILFHCSKSTAHGASGSPLIQNENDQPEVIGMLLEGFPKIYYNEFCTNPEANKRPDLLMESGISMEKVKSLLLEHGLSELSENIFTRSI